MKKIYIFLMTLMLVLGLSVSGHATLIDRGGGLIYDDDLNITWLSDLNYAKTSGYDADGVMTWSEAVTWADNLVYGDYDDWRLPTSNTCVSYNCTGSEMGHLYYSELGGTAGTSISSNLDPDLGLFTNLIHYSYWSGTESLPRSQGISHSTTSSVATKARTIKA